MFQDVHEARGSRVARVPSVQLRRSDLAQLDAIVGHAQQHYKKYLSSPGALGSCYSLLRARRLLRKFEDTPREAVRELSTRACVAAGTILLASGPFVASKPYQALNFFRDGGDKKHVPPLAQASVYLGC